MDLKFYCLFEVVDFWCVLGGIVLILLLFFVEIFLKIGFFRFFFFNVSSVIWSMVKKGWLLFNSCWSCKYLELEFVVLDMKIFLLLVLGLYWLSNRVFNIVMVFFISGSLIYCLLVFLWNVED